MTLKIRQRDECEFDIISLGECMIRLSPPGHQKIEFSPYFEAWCGGAEYNVTYALARLGLKTSWISRLVENPLGHFIRNHAGVSRMDLSEVVWIPYDGVGSKDRIGLNFTEVGTGIRASSTTYDRGHSAISNMKFDDVDWERIFYKRKTRWFHTGGIFTALSGSCADISKKVMKIAKESGAVVSYDLNFRSKLWSSERAIKTTKELIPYIDVLIGNEEDFQKALGVDIEGISNDSTGLSVETYKKLVKKVNSLYPHLKMTGTTLREVKSGLLNNWSAILYSDGKFYESKYYKNLEIEDRIGGGDGFCSGLIYGILNDFSPQDSVDLGTAHGALLQSTRGDTSMITKEELMHVFKGGSARIKR